MRWFTLLLIANAALAAPVTEAKKPVREAPAAAPREAAEAEPREVRSGAATEPGDAATVTGRPAEAQKDDEAQMRRSALVGNRAREFQALERYPEAARSLGKFASVAAGFSAVGGT